LLIRVSFYYGLLLLFYFSNAQLGVPVVQIPHRTGFDVGAGFEKAAERSPAAITNEQTYPRIP
jgi:hypothetical protein